MDNPALNKDDRENVMNVLRDFVLRVASDTDNKWPSEVAVLPAITELFLTNSYLLNMKYV